MSKYNVGDKFIIEIIKDDIAKLDTTEYCITNVGRVLEERELNELQKYNGSTISEDTLEMVRMKALNDGRNEVWELAKKLYEMKIEQLQEVFGAFETELEVMNYLAPQEALAKLEAYEKEQNEIKVGDVVYDLDGNKKVVLFIDFTNKAYIYGRYGITQIKKEHLTKTGKHIDIQSVLQQIGE